MTRYFVVFAYDGTNYHGWQIQPNGNSVQEELQKALSILLRENIEVVGAGRTDAGVHARRMTAHFETERAVDCAQLTYKLGRLLPRDISVYDVYPVAPDMHARFSATLRTYHYYAHADVKTTLCNVTEAKWLRDADDQWHFRISANRFLRNMVRAVVGTLIEVGRHRMTIDQFDKVVASGSRSNAGESMPGNALFLEDVRY